MRTKALYFPKSILIETSNRCQGECGFCPYKKIRMNDKPEFLDFEKYKEMIEEISQYSIVRLTLFNNNEPLLDKRICDFIAYAHNKLPNIEITLSTNGRLVTLEKLYELQKSGLTTLYISIPTINEENYNLIMRTSSNKLVELLKKINDTKLLKMIRIAVPKTKFLDHDLMVSELGKYLICEWGLEYKENWNIDETFEILSEFVEYEGPCDRPMDQMVINSNGNVIICCRDWKSQNVIGNIYSNSLFEIWHSDEMKNIQNHIANKNYDKISCCKDCTLNEKYYLRKKRNYEISKKITK